MFQTHKQATILVVDDDPSSNDLILVLLEPFVHVIVARNSRDGLKQALALHPDLILMDLNLPRHSGYTVCQELKNNPLTADIPVILMSAYLDAEREARSFDVGAADCIRKPINQRVAWSRIQVQLTLKVANDALRSREAYLEGEVLRRTAQIETMQKISLLALGNLAKTRDLETGNHILRTQTYVRMLAEKLSTHPRFSAVLTPQTIIWMAQSAPLHDIGKVGIPDSILRKPGPLSPDEWVIMKTHTTLGVQALEDAERQHGQPIEFLHYAKEIAGGHHERWDGTGYPNGLAGEAIPVSARLMAVSDVYDALLSRRVYKEPIPPEKALEMMKKSSGTHFDPDVIEALVELAPECAAFAAKHSD